MMSALVILLFCGLSVAVFLIDSVQILTLLILVGLLVSLTISKSWHRSRKFLIYNSGFLSFIFLCNLLFSGYQAALLITLRLFLVLVSAYLVNAKLSAQQLASGFTKLLIPLKIFHVNYQQLALIIAITISLLPSLTTEARFCQLSLRSKGLTLRSTTPLRYARVILLLYLRRLLSRVDSLEKTLLAHGYRAEDN